MLLWSMLPMSGSRSSVPLEAIQLFQPAPKFFLVDLVKTSQ